MHGVSVANDEHWAAAGLGKKKKIEKQTGVLLHPVRRVWGVHEA